MGGVQFSLVMLFSQIMNKFGRVSIDADLFERFFFFQRKNLFRFLGTCLRALLLSLASLEKTNVGHLLRLWFLTFVIATNFNFLACYILAPLTRFLNFFPNFNLQTTR